MPANPTTTSPARKTKNPKVPVVAPTAPDTMWQIIRPQAQGRWLLPQLASITPTYIETVLRGALAGSHVQQWQLFDLMEDTWPRLAKNLLEVKRSVAQMNWQLEPYADEDQPPTPEAIARARVVSRAVWTMRPNVAADENDFKGTLFDILDAWAKGVSVLELDWELRNTGALGEIWAPRASVWAHPTNYAWANEGFMGLVQGVQTAVNSQNFRIVQPFPDNKFLLAISKAKTGHPFASALLRPLAWWWCAANFSADWLLNFAQVFGLPFRWANYDKNAPQAIVDKICSMLENMGSAGWAAFPDGTTLDLKEASKAGAATPQADVLDRADKQADLLILGQTLTTDVGSSGSLALGQVHEGVLGEVKQAAANFAAGVVNSQLVPAILRLNFGDDSEAPEFCPEPHKTEDAKANAERDQVLLKAGMVLPKAWLYKRHNVPLPTANEETIGGATEPAAEDRLEDPKEKLQARNAQGEGQLVDAAKEELARALIADLAPITRRLDRILQINDPLLLESKLTELFSDLDQLKADIQADPATAVALQKIVSAGLVNGFTKRKANP